MRYFLSNLFAYPVKTISLTLCLILLILIFYLILVAGFIGPITNQVNAIEPAIEEFKNHNIKIDSIRLAVTSEYVAIYERLKPSDKKHSYSELLFNHCQVNYHALPRGQFKLCYSKFFPGSI